MKMIRLFLAALVGGLGCSARSAGETFQEDLPSTRAASTRAIAGELSSNVTVSGIACRQPSHPMFRHWAFAIQAPVECVFRAQPKSEYQVFVGLIEAHWKEAGKRVMDVWINGKAVETVDAFPGEPKVPHGRLYPVKADANGTIRISIRPNPQAPDRNPAVCGFLLFGANKPIEPGLIIEGAGPKPLAAVIAGQREEEALAALLRDRGRYFAKKTYQPEPIPRFDESRGKLPSPILDESPQAVACYWKAWELAFSHFRQPHPGSPAVANYIDEAFNESLFLWDTVFMTMFCNYAHPYVPGIQSLDNFYATQLADGEIVREISEVTGIPNPASKPGTPDSLNHPLLAWAEREAYRLSGDRDRLRLVYEPLVRYYRSYEKIRDPETGFYRTSWASMDNSPRNAGLRCGIDTTSEMVLFARDLAFLAGELGRNQEVAQFNREAEELTRRINDRLWDEQTGFYYDWSTQGRRHNVRTVAGFWTLLAQIADPPRQEQLIGHLRNPAQFARLHQVPTVPADQEGYGAEGEYWRGAVWAPTTTMVVRGLERNGHHDLARAIALNHLTNVVAVFQQTGTLWENYAPDTVAPGKVDGHLVKPDFVGWTGIVPIVLLMEYGIGLQVDAPQRTVTWHITSEERVGVERLWFGRITATLVCDKAKEGRRRVIGQADGPFRLILRYQDHTREVSITPGKAFEISL